MSTLNIMIGEILVDKKVSKRTMVELQDLEVDEQRKLIMEASFEADAMTAKEKAKHVKSYQEGLYEYGMEDNTVPAGHSALDILRMKNVALSKKQKAELVGSLTLDEKLFYGSWLNDNENTIQTLELGDEGLTFGSKTYEDGLEVFTNNKG